MEPRGCQQPLCSLVKAEFLTLTSMLSQLLEKQRKLICVNDRTEDLAGGRARMCASEFQGPAPAWDLCGGVPGLACHSRGSWCLFKNQNPEIEPGPEILCPAWLFFSGLCSSPGLHSCTCFAQRLICSYRGVRGRTGPACAPSPLHWRTARSANVSLHALSDPVPICDCHMPRQG